MHALHAAAALCLRASVTSGSEGIAAGPLTDVDRAAISKTLGLTRNPKGPTSARSFTSGSTFPVWSGTRDAGARRTISDAPLSKIEAKFLP
jgi:hypothetical protein